MNRHRERSFDWKSIPLVDWKSIPLTAHFCVMSVYVMFATGPQAILSFAFASLTLVASCETAKRIMQSSTPIAPQATSALDAAFVGSAFSQPTAHGDSARPYGNPHSS